MVLPLNDESMKVFEGDAKNFANPRIKSLGKFQAVVGEGNLGPALHHPLPRQEEKVLAQRLANELYRPFLRSLPSVLEPGAHIVIALPRWQNIGVSALLLDEIARFGYAQREEFFYGRPNQFVTRDILHLIWQGKRI